MTLRFLATGDSQQTLSYSFRIREATVIKIVSETCEAIYSALKQKYLSYPKCEDNWLHILEQSEEMWNMSHTIRCTDGKHIRTECPKLKMSQILFDFGQYG